MQGQLDHQPKLLEVLNLELFVPKNHSLRKFDRVLDLGFIREFTEKFYCLENGRPSVDPELFMRMALLSHIYGITSDRMLCEEVHCNLAYRWFCRLSLEEVVPDHSSLTRIRDRLGEKTFQILFDQIIEQCRRAGLVPGKRVIADGTLVDANASLYSLVRVGEEAKIENSDAKHRKVRDIRKEKISNQTHKSATDPDAALAGKLGNKMLVRYKDHRIVDADSRVILDTHVTSGAVMEGKIFTDRLKKTENRLNLEIEEVIADRGYGYGENLSKLLEDGRGVFVPTFHKDVGERLEEFTFNEEKNVLVCPTGKILTPQKSVAGVTRYRTERDACVGCPMAGTCKSRHREGTFFRFLMVPEHHKAHAAIRERERTPEFRTRMRERMWKVEGLFAEGKRSHGLSRAKYRGRAKMQIQAYLVACVQNLKRLAGGMSGGLFDLIANWIETFSIAIQIVKFQKPAT